MMELWPLIQNHFELCLNKEPMRINDSMKCFNGFVGGSY